MSASFMIYGSYGYTGELVVDLALQRGMRPILAGRNEQKLKAQAEGSGLEYRAFDLDDPKLLLEKLQGVALVLHCAGPFSKTAKPMVQACLGLGIHYVDITGEIEVFEKLARLDSKAKDAGTVILPGAGFDVVPSDCLAARLKEKMPDAQSLELAIYSRGGQSSHGTAKTAIEGLGKGSVIRKGGKLTPVPLAWKVLELEFDGKQRQAPCIPWGDISTAWFSTGIPDIMTCMVFPPKMVRMMKFSRYIGFILRMKWVQNRMKKRILAGPKGPSAEQRAKSISIVWGRVCNAAGEELIGKLECANGYSLTADTSLRIVEKILSGSVEPGYHTPSSAFGSGFILEAEGSRFIGV